MTADNVLSSIENRVLGLVILLDDKDRPYGGRGCANVISPLHAMAVR